MDNLNIKPDGLYLDGTLGGGGHSYHIAEKLTAGGRLIGIDQDEEAIAAATKRLEPFSDRVTIIRDNYENAVTRLREIGITGVDGILLDLGVSSYQLDNVQRGFSYKFDTELDMRMDTRQNLSARDIVNTWSEMEIYHIIRDYGEDQFAKNIAKHIVMARKDKPIETTGQLNEIIHDGRHRITCNWGLRNGNCLCPAFADFYCNRRIYLCTGRYISYAAGKLF